MWLHVACGVWVRLGYPGVYIWWCVVVGAGLWVWLVVPGCGWCMQLWLDVAGGVWVYSWSTGVLFSSG